MPTLPSAIHLRLITSAHDLLSLESQWNQLLRSSLNNSVFLTFEYVTTWWDVYGSNRKLRLLTAWSDDTLIGAAPLAIGPGPQPVRSWLRHLAFLGFHGDELSEFLDFLILPRFREELTARFLDFLLDEMGDEWDTFFLSMVPSDSPSLASLLPSAGSRGLSSQPREEVPCPYLPLPGTWEELLQSKSKNFRKSFQNVWNRLQKHQVEILHAGTDISIDEAFSVLLQLNRARWGADRQSFTSEMTTRFHRNLAHRFHQHGWLSFFLMKIDGVFAAARFDYVYGGKLWNIQGGWNPDLAALSPGRMIIAYQIQWCIQQGLKEYDFLGGEAGYKRSWATQERQLQNLEFPHPRSRRARLFFSLRHWHLRIKAARPFSSSPPAQAPLAPQT